MILKDHEIVKYLTLWAQRSGWTPDSRSFELGRLSVGLSLESQARIFEDYGTMTSLSINKELVASALRDCLRSLGLDDDALDAYDAITRMKLADRPNYVETSDLLLHDRAPASQPSGQHQTVPPLQGHVELHQARMAEDLEQEFLADYERSIEEAEAELSEEYRSHE